MSEEPKPSAADYEVARQCVGNTLEHEEASWEMNAELIRRHVAAVTRAPALTRVLELNAQRNAMAFGESHAEEAAQHMRRAFAQSH